MAVNDIFGPISPPPGVNQWIPKGSSGDVARGLLPFANAIVKLLIVVGGLYAFLNIIFAGYQFMSAGGDSKQMEKAWAKIWQSLLGLLIVAGSFVLAVIFGKLLFNDPMAILQPQIYTP